MRRHSLLLVASLLITTCAQAQLTRSLNGMRIGDEIVKQQVEYKNPGKPGIDRFWDFSELTAINPEYTLDYSLPGMVGDTLYVMGMDTLRMDSPSTGELFVGTEHLTMYYYQLRNDSLLQLGHENSNVELKYHKPLFHLKFPFNYGDAIASGYHANGSYSGLSEIHAEGTMRTEADAFGQMVLPDGDTLTVMRVKGTRLIVEPMLLDDSIETFRSRIMETYQWYSKGYRYPVFESIRTVDLGDSISNFRTAFYYPPQEHHYLDTDPENVAILDSLWEVKSRITEEKENNYKVKMREFKFKVYPNPVEDILYVEYELEKDSPVIIYVYDMGGKQWYNSGLKNRTHGFQIENLNCTAFPSGNYLIKFIAGAEIINRKIIKK